MSGQRKSVIVTFKTKDKRPNKDKDKVDIVKSVMPQGHGTHFFDAMNLPSGGSLPAIDDDQIGFDINHFEAPLVSVRLTDGEIDQLAKDGNVEEVEEDYPCYLANRTGVFGHLVTQDQPSPKEETIPAGVSQVRAPAAWPSSQGEGVRVAVVDTGIDFKHPDLATNYKGGISFVPGAATPMDDHGHGTHAAGIIAATFNGAGLVGVAPAAHLYSVKVFSGTGSAQFSQIISGIDWCIKNQMHIINMSIGGPKAPNALRHICSVAWKKGLLMIASTGNNGAPEKDQESSVSYPARFKTVVAVSAIGPNRAFAPFAGYGPEVDIAAPGIEVLSTTRGGGYGTMSGTSMACPHVAGAAAVVWGAHRFATNQQIWDLLAHHADNLGPVGWDNKFGYGRVNVDRAALAFSPAPTMAKNGY